MFIKPIIQIFVIDKHILRLLFNKLLKERVIDRNDF